MHNQHPPNLTKCFLTDVMLFNVFLLSDGD
jgi:hypothetical protein